MMLNPSRHFLYQQPQHQPHHHQPASSGLFNNHSSNIHSDGNSNSDYTRLSDLDLDLDLDLDIDLDAAGSLNFHSLSSSPVSTQSILSQYSSIASSPLLSSFDSIPTPTLAEPQPSLFPPLRQSSSQAVAQSSAAPFFPHTGAMQTEAWMPSGQLTPRSVGRFSHQRDTSQSSMGSNGPVSPYSHNIANPQIAVNDSVGDSFHNLSGADDLGNYQLAAKSFPGVTHDNFYTALPGYGATDGNGGVPPYPYLATAPRRRNDPIGSARPQPVSHSHPVSVASSIASDSPATPAGEPEEDRKRGIAIHPVPKLDRTMTDAYTDELYSPNFTIASSSSGQASISPTSDLFNQRLQAANNQHLTAVTNSPVSATSRDRSPFRQGSPLAPLPMHDFPSSTMGPSQVRFGSAQQLREQSKAMRDAQAVQQQIARSAATSTPQTISPKDAMLEFHEPEGDANFPLFPQQNGNGFNGEAINKAAAAQSQQVFGGLPMDTSAFNNFLATSMPATSMPTAIPVPQQYGFLAQPRSQSAVDRKSVV